MIRLFREEEAMRTLILYYSRTGTTRKAAEALAGLLGADLAEIRCDRYRTGVFSYIRAAYDSIRRNLPAIEISPAARQPYDRIVIGGPIWAGRPASPVRSYLAGNNRLPGRVALFLTRIGSPPEPAFAEMEALLPAPAEAKLALRSGDVERDRIAPALTEFAAKLRNGADNRDEGRAQ
jgi:hypothetical protein